MKKSLVASFWVLGIIWAVFLIDMVLPGDFRQYGVRPHEIKGLVGIITAPFLHADITHIISNSIPLFILTLTLLTFYRKIWIPVTIFSILLGGLGVWLLCFRSGTNHIGASGVIFSYIAFLIFSGVFRKTFKAFAVGVAVFFLYGGTLLFGVIPTTPGVSWEGHLYGALAGIAIAWMYRTTDTTNETVGG